MSASDIIDVVVLKRSSIDEHGSQELAQLIGEMCELRETYCLDWLDAKFLKRVGLIVTYSGDMAEFAADILSMHRMRQHVSWQDNSGLCIIVSDKLAYEQLNFNDILFFLTEMIGRYCFYSLLEAKTWLPKILSNLSEIPREVYDSNRPSTGIQVVFSISSEDKSGNRKIERLLSSQKLPVVKVVRSEEAGNKLTKYEVPIILITYAYEDAELVSQMFFINRLRSDGLIRDSDTVVFILGSKVSPTWQSDLLLNVLLRLSSVNVVTTLDMAIERVLPSVLNDIAGR